MSKTSLNLLSKFQFPKARPSPYTSHSKLVKLHASARYFFMFFFLFAVFGLMAQDLQNGQEALTTAGESIKGYIEPIKNIIYIVATIVALIGVVRVYTSWQMGDSGVISTAIGWFGSAIFLLVAISMVENFFGT